MSAVRGSVVRVLAATALLGQMAACSSGERGEPEPVSTGQTPGRYVITAVDNHFHDAHPSGPIQIDGALVVTNAGSNLHNVTITGSTYTSDVAVDGEIVIDPVSEVLSRPGRYRVVCKYHLDSGMKGTLVVVE